MFIQILDSVCRDYIVPSALRTLLVTVTGGELPANVVETEVAKMVLVHSQWKWEAVSHINNVFLVSFPSFEDLQRVVAFQIRVKSHGMVISFSELKVDHIPSYFALETVWVHVSGVPHSLRRFLGPWDVGSAICATQNVNLPALRHHGIVRIQVAVLSRDIFFSKDDLGLASTTSDVYVKPNGYSFHNEL